MQPRDDSVVGALRLGLAAGGACVPLRYLVLEQDARHRQIWPGGE
jgi:hypothetical protein